MRARRRARTRTALRPAFGTTIAALGSAWETPGAGAYETTYRPPRAEHARGAQSLTHGLTKTCAPRVSLGGKVNRCAHSITHSGYIERAAFEVRHVPGPGAYRPTCTLDGRPATVRQDRLTPTSGTFSSGGRF